MDPIPIDRLAAELGTELVMTKMRALAAEAKVAALQNELTVLKESQELADEPTPESP